MEFLPANDALQRRLYLCLSYGCHMHITADGLKTAGGGDAPINEPAKRWERQRHVNMNASSAGFEIFQILALQIFLKSIAFSPEGFTRCAHINTAFVNFSIYIWKNFRSNSPE